MKYLPTIYLLLCVFYWPLNAQTTPTNNSWDIVQAYQSSTHVFYGKLTRRVQIPNFKTDLVGVRINQLSKATLPTEPIVWPKATELSFSIDESFKGTTNETFVAYQITPDLNVWPQVQNEAGDIFLAQPIQMNPLMARLEIGTPSLFYARYYLGSNIPIIYRVRYGQRATDDLALLRTFQKSGNARLEDIVAQSKIQKAKEAQLEAIEFKQLEDDYYKILRIQDVDIRSSLLIDLIARMGYKGRWDYFDFKQRYIKLYGLYIDINDIPPGPTEGKEKLWHDISGELDRIDVIKKARSIKR